MATVKFRAFKGNDFRDSGFGFMEHGFNGMARANVGVLYEAPGRVKDHQTMLEFAALAKAVEAASGCELVSTEHVGGRYGYEFVMVFDVKITDKSTPENNFAAEKQANRILRNALNSVL